MGQLVSDKDVEFYKKNGAVCVRGVFDPDLIAELRANWAETEATLTKLEPVHCVPEQLLEDDKDLALEVADIVSVERQQSMVNNGSMGVKWAFFKNPVIQKFVRNSPAAQLVGELLETDEVRFFWDQMFVRKAGSKVATYWHTDMAAWPVQGVEIPSLWVPMTPIRKGVNALEVIKGSHLTFDEAEWPRTLNAQRMGDIPAGRKDFIDWEERRETHAHQFLSFDMEPGDAMLIDARVYHGGGINHDPNSDRIALSTRWVGSDIRWDPRPECVNVPGVPLHSMKPGERPSNDDIFPMIWQAQEVAL